MVGKPRSVIEEKGRWTGGIQVCGRQWSFGSLYGPCVFVDCGKCDLSLIAKFETNEKVDQFTDGQFVELGKQRGWRVSKKGISFCPKCKGKEKEQTDGAESSGRPQGTG